MSNPEKRIHELQEEILFQRVLLSSIDDTVQNRAQAEQDVKDEIHSLQRQLVKLKRGTTADLTTASTLSQPASSQRIEATPRSSSPRSKSASNAASMEGYPDRTWYSRTCAGASSTASTPNSAYSFHNLQDHEGYSGGNGEMNRPDRLGELVSPSRMNLPGRKRSHSKHLDGLAPYENKSQSRRTSPSPYQTRPSTPSTSISGDEAILEAFDNEIRQLQASEEEKRRQEKRDEEYARTLFATTMNTPALNPAAKISSNLGPSAFDRLSGIRPLPSSATSFGRPTLPQPVASSSRTPSWASQSTTATVGYVPPEGALVYPIMDSGLKRENNSSSLAGFSRYASEQIDKYSQFKPEPSFSTPVMPGTFRDDSSEASDSDIEIIGPEAFYGNGNRNSVVSGQKFGTATGPNYHSSQAEEIPDNNSVRRVDQAAKNDALTMALYGGNPVPNWMNMPAPSTQPGMSSLDPLGDFGPVSSYVQPMPPFGFNSGAYGQPSMVTNNIFDCNNGNAFMPPQYSTANLHFLEPGPAGYQPLKPDPLADIFALSGNNYAQPLNHFDERMTNQFDYIMNDPRKTNDEIKALLENIRPDVELPPEDREGTPDGLKYPLYEHQKLALTWLKSMEEGTNKGGILADDMGLGKTISALALMLSRPSKDRARKTTVVVGPVALVRQWEKEIKTKVTASHRLTVHLVHGQQRRLAWDELRAFDVVLTTYGTLSAEFKRMEKWIETQKVANRGEYDVAPMAKLFPLLGPKSLFYRIFLDEAQCIKNKTTMAAKAACNLKSLYRFCLTGTPMMNNVGELYSLIHFLRIKPYNEHTRFQETFGILTKPDKNRGGRSDTDKAMRRLQTLLKAILLRRTKTSLIDGKPIINLPPKTEEIQHVVFSEEEQDFYKALESKTQIQFNKYLRAGTVGKNYSNILVLLLRLRQACCHPHLIRGDFEEATPAGADINMDTMVQLAQSLSPEVVARLLELESFECPVCYDAAENPRIIVPCGHDTCSECLTKITDQAVQQHVAEGNDGAASAFKCPTCRGSLKLDSIIDYTIFKKVHKPDPNATDETTVSDSGTDNDDMTESESESETDDDEVDRDGDLRNFIVPDDIEDSDDDQEPRQVAPKSKSKKKVVKQHQKKKGKKKEKQSVSLAILKKEASRSEKNRRRYMRFLRKNWQTSAKVEKCVELLEKFGNDGQKTIIFSQFVTLLDLLQVPIDEKGWKCLRYDGGMSADRRNKAIEEFTDKADSNIMLISLKAGNSGLNLVAASRVIILDPFWNPYIEMQAVDRAYRIGQQRSVQVHRILIEGTVEDRIMDLQERKRDLVSSALDEGASRDIGRLGLQEFALLFGIGGN